MRTDDKNSMHTKLNPNPCQRQSKCTGSTLHVTRWYVVLYSKIEMQWPVEVPTIHKHHNDDDDETNNLFENQWNLRDQQLQERKKRPKNQIQWMIGPKRMYSASSTFDRQCIVPCTESCMRYNNHRCSVMLLWCVKFFNIFTTVFVSGKSYSQLYFRHLKTRWSLPKCSLVRRINTERSTTQVCEGEWNATAPSESKETVFYILHTHTSTHPHLSEYRRKIIKFSQTGVFILCLFVSFIHFPHSQCLSSCVCLELFLFVTHTHTLSCRPRRQRRRETICVRMCSKS